MIFDSLSGSSRSRVVNTLRDYLLIEYQTKRPQAERPYDKLAVKGHCLNVPQQNNYSDCGVYVLQYAQSFIEVCPSSSVFVFQRKLIASPCSHVFTRDRIYS